MGWEKNGILMLFLKHKPGAASGPGAVLTGVRVLAAVAAHTALSGTALDAGCAHTQGLSDEYQC